jgi:hypothetical protein
MWLLVTRTPAPDAPYWRGRRLLAALDAVAWPLAWVWVLRSGPEPGGLIVVVVCAWAVMSAGARLHRAVRANHRYRFTTWRWGRVLISLLAFGLLLKLLSR